MSLVSAAVDRGVPSYAGAVTTAEMIELAKRMGVEVTITTAPPKPTGEITLRPGVRRPRDA